jgi:hypothetical protein
MTSGDWIAARTRMGCPQRGQVKASAPNTRASSCAHGNLVERRGSPTSSPATCSAGSSESARRVLPESSPSGGPGAAGTTRSRQPAAGASMPCYAERVIMRSIAAGALRFLCVGGQFATSLHVDSSA